MIIKIKNLRASTIIGVYEWERDIQRHLILNIELEIDGTKSGASDDINDTLNYDSLSKMIIAEISNTRYQLLEKLVTHLLDKVMEDKMVKRVRIEIDKGGVVKDVDSISVIDERIRN